MDEKEFNEIVQDEWNAIPTEIALKIVNVALRIEDEPSEETLLAQGVEEGSTLLGLYVGIPLTERGADYGTGPTLPDTITLYRFPILDESQEGGGSAEAVREVIRSTIWHEVGHYFGHGDSALHEREEEGTDDFPE